MLNLQLEESKSTQCIVITCSIITIIRELRSLKEEIVLMRKKVANVNAQIEQKESLKRPSAQDEISDLKLRIEVKQAKNYLLLKLEHFRPIEIE